MTNFVVIFYGGKPPTDYEGLSKSLSLWSAWFQELGEDLIDQGNPISQGYKVDNKDIEKDLSEDTPSGYVIFRAREIEEAAKIAQRSPVVQEGGRALVYEVFKIM